MSGNTGGAICDMMERMKKQASDQQSHDRRYQERKRAEAARQPLKKKASPEVSTPIVPGDATKK
jgi:hypothetical protein